ncbi:CG30275, partial [Drosophila busckii]
TGEFVVRRATRDDIKPICTLISAGDVKWFGNKRPKYGAKKALMQSYQTHRFVVVLKHAVDNELLAYGEFRNYPALGPLPGDSWMDWLLGKYCINIPISWLNTLFFNFCTYKSAHPEVLLALVRELFYIENRIWYLLTVRMPEVKGNFYYAESFDDLEKYANVLYPREFSITSNTNTQSVYVIPRFQLLPKISYRKALAEDNDDIIDIHSLEMPELRAKLGDYYIAEELLRQDDDAKKNYLIVVELENECQESETAGFMWLTSDIDIRFYVRNYELETFGNLLKFISDKPYAFEEILVSSVDPKAQASLFTNEAIDDLYAETIIGGVQRNDSGTSVASVSKMKVSSIHGTIVDEAFSGGSNKFYMREALFLKFQYIFETLLTINYYISEKNKLINLFYNVKTKSDQHDSFLEQASNVFILKYISVDQKFPIERIFSCICAMFSVFPERDYCMMTMPKTAKSVRSQEEVLKYFMASSRTFLKQTNLEDVYITHRSTIFGEISLYKLEANDVETVQDLILGGSTQMTSSFLYPDSSFSYSSKVNAYADIEHELNVLNLIMTDVLNNDDTEYFAFTIRCGNSTKLAQENTIIGFVFLRPYNCHHELLHHYHLPNFDHHLKFHRAEILSLKLHPLFHISSDVIFRELAKNTNYFDFYFITSREVECLSNDLKTMMMLIEPRALKRSLCLGVKHTEVPSVLKLPQRDYMCDHLIVYRHKLNPSKWFVNNKRLVIIGFTNESKAFLRQLLFQWNSKDHRNSEVYNCLPRLQVTVIARPGLVEADYDSKFECPYCEDKRFCYVFYQNSPCYVRDVVYRMDLRNYVHFVVGHVNYINREEKYVKINQSCEIHYDTLLLMNSRSYGVSNEALFVDERKRLPSNFVVINDRIDKIMLFYKIRVLLEEIKRSYLLLIYGANLQTFECIAFLLSHGIDPTRLVLVLPHITTGIEAEEKLSNPYIDKNLQMIIEDMLIDSGVKIHRDMNFSHWIQGGMVNFIMEVVFHSFPQKVEYCFDCDIFISFEEGHMDQKVKDWLTDSDIKLNNRKVQVDKNFRTNDPDIYAVGKFIEIVGEPALNHQYKYTSERETASKLMYILGLADSDTPFEYKYSQPAFFQALLPLDYIITKVTMPRRYLATHFTSCFNCAMTTYWQNNFCRIGLTPKKIVDEIVVVSKQKRRFDFLEFFCGKHESMLNNLSIRYKAGTIKCLLCFLEEPWTELLTHDDFDELQARNHMLLRPMIISMQQARTSSGERESTYSDADFLSVNQRVLEHNVLNFLRKHRREFQHEFALPEDYKKIKL